MRSVILPEFPNYQINEDGTILSLKTKRFLKGAIDPSNGYVVINLRTADGRHPKQYLHRLLAIAFIPREEGKNYIDHINGIRDDNRLENLRWCTGKENCNFPLAKQHQKEWRESEAGKADRTRRGLEHRKPVADETYRLIFSGGVEACEIVGLSKKGRADHGYPCRGHMLVPYDPEKHIGYEPYDPQKHSHLFFTDIEGKARPLLCVTDNKLFKRAKDAASFYNTSLQNIARCARGERHTTVGKEFRYVSWEEFNALKTTREVIE